MRNARWWGLKFNPPSSQQKRIGGRARCPGRRDFPSLRCVCLFHGENTARRTGPVCRTARRNVDVGQATPSRRFRRSCPCGAVPVTFPGSSPLPLGRLAASEGPRTQSCAWPARIARCCEIASCVPHLHLKQDRQVYVSVSRKVCAFLRRNVLLPGMCPVNVFSRCRSQRPGRVRSVW